MANINQKVKELEEQFRQLQLEIKNLSTNKQEFQTRQVFKGDIQVMGTIYDKDGNVIS